MSDLLQRLSPRDQDLFAEIHFNATTRLTDQARVQTIFDAHSEQFDQLLEAGLRHSDLAALLHEAGISGKHGDPLSIRTISKALHRARSLPESRIQADPSTDRQCGCPHSNCPLRAPNEVAFGPEPGTTPSPSVAIDAVPFPIPPPSANSLLSLTLRELPLKIRNPVMNPLANSTILSRLMVDVHNDKGGVGKTTFTNVLKAFFGSFGIPVQVFRIDSSFSTATRPEDVLIPAESFVESGDLVGGITALYEKVWDAIAEAAGVTIIDWGAGLTGVRNAIYRSSSLSELIEAAGVDAISCVITDATAPVMRQAAQAMDMDREIVPAMRRALVCNGMRGAFQFAPHCEEAKVFQSELVPKLRDALRINFPQIPANAWQPFAAAGLSFEDALGRDIGVLSKTTGQSIYRTTACRNALSTWWTIVQPELARFLPVTRTAA